MNILEIGIGRGGGHIHHDGPDDFRVGIDRKLTVLHMAKKDHTDMAPVLDTLYANERVSLPFADGSFSCVEFRFPHDDLMHWLTSTTLTLWPEFSRVLDENGQVSVMFDVPPDSVRILKVRSEGKDISVYRPEDHMWRMATEAGFNVSIKKLTKQEVYDSGSIYGKCAAHWIKISGGLHSAYHLIATKR